MIRITYTLLILRDGRKKRIKSQLRAIFPNHFSQNMIYCGIKRRRKDANTYIHTYFIGSSPRGFSESILHYKIINQVHDNKNITMIKEDKGQ